MSTRKYVQPDSTTQETDSNYVYPIYFSDIQTCRELTDEEVLRFETDTERCFRSDLSSLLDYIEDLTYENSPFCIAGSYPLYMKRDIHEHNDIDIFLNFENDSVMYEEDTLYDGKHFYQTIYQTDFIYYEKSSLKNSRDYCFRILEEADISCCRTGIFYENEKWWLMQLGEGMGSLYVDCLKFYTEVRRMRNREGRIKKYIDRLQSEESKASCRDVMSNSIST